MADMNVAGATDGFSAGDSGIIELVCVAAAINDGRIRNGVSILISASMLFLLKNAEFDGAIDALPSGDVSAMEIVEEEVLIDELAVPLDNELSADGVAPLGIEETGLAASIGADAMEIAEVKGLIDELAVPLDNELLLGSCSVWKEGGKRPSITGEKNALSDSGICLVWNSPFTPLMIQLSYVPYSLVGLIITVSGCNFSFFPNREISFWPGSLMRVIVVIIDSVSRITVSERLSRLLKCANRNISPVYVTFAATCVSWS